MSTKICPSCSVEVPAQAARCKECFHDFTEVKGRNGSPMMLLAAMAAMSVVGAFTFWWVSSRPIEERILVDQETQSIIWTRKYNDGVKTERLRFERIAKLEYQIDGSGDFTILAVTLDGERKTVMESDGTPIRSTAEQYAQLMEKPLEVVDNTRGFHKTDE